VTDRSMTPDPAPVAALEQLIAKWRERSQLEQEFERCAASAMIADAEGARRHRIASLLFKECADELSTLLAASRPAQEGPTCPTCGSCVNRTVAAPEATEATREALEDMVYQFGHDCVKGGQPAIGTGGLSALEGAFAVLGWEDPYVIPDPVWCDAPVEPRCPNRVSCGTPTPDGYKQFCHDHFHLWQAAQRPSVADSSMAPSRVGGNTKQSSDLGEITPPEPQP
jgi:hypothetical protein